ncbi:MAG TPA: ABC transporter ATP-binding protein [Terriglobales bacterium]|nr:ABC transporter ATP-binding protein [Terriglobales bacterium]
MIEFKNVSKKYARGEGGTVKALSHVSFQVAPGEFVVVRGASGSGKSTLLNLLGCLDRPSSGSYWLNGEDVAGYSDRQLSRLRNARIGFVFQSFNLLPRTTALENVEVPMVYGDGNVDSRRAASALERVGLGGRAKHFASELSGGEQQRVAIARALINDPAIILADEPTGNLDLNAGEQVMRLLQELRQEGRTILLVTHDDAVAQYAARELLLRDGEIISDRPVGAAASGPGAGGTA